MITIKPYVSITDDIAPGDTVRANHRDCPAGEDTRRRLYLTRTRSDPDALVAYCHNCQDGGYLRGIIKFESYRKVKHMDGTAAKTVRMDELKEPVNLEPNFNLWPTHAIGWAFKNKLNSVLVHQYGLQYDASSERVYIPRYSRVAKGVETPELTGYQLRNTDAHLDVPKYLTVVGENDKGYTMMYGSSKATSGSTMVFLVVVEDYVSGIAIIEAFKDDPTLVHCIVNYGTKVNLEACHHAARYDSIVVWLDNDSSHVKNQAHVMARTIGLMNTNIDVAVESMYHDPKQYPDDTIRSIILAYGP